MAESLTLAGPVRRGKFCEAVGPGAAWLGREEGVFEAWVYPFKILHNLRPVFRVGKGAAAPGGRLAKKIEVSPSSTTIIYSHPFFTVRQTLFVPRSEPAAVSLFEVQAKRGLDLEVSFAADLVPMWPAGLGGQYCLWEEKLSAFLILEASGKYAGLVGLPQSQPHAKLIAHEPPRQDLRLGLTVSPQDGRKIFPLVVTGSAKGCQDAIQIYRRVLRNISKLFHQNLEHSRRLREEFLAIETPDPQVNRAFEWAKIALDRGVVNNPQLGTGLVAGYGEAGSSQRPGFGWFFGGDASMNALAILDYGDFETVRQVLEFLIKYQRKDGKIPHEITQSASLIRWFEDYSFGFIHAETTAWFLGAVADYYQRSGDRKFVRENWSAIKKAFQFLIENDRDRDGLMENQAAGLGAAETGPLRAISTKVDIFVASLGAWAHRGVVQLATVAGDAVTERKALFLAQKSTASLKKLFFNRPGRPGRFALKSNGMFVNEETAWPVMALALRLIDSDSVEGTLKSLSSVNLSTPWGVRILSRRSPHYDAAGYNSGAVWPFLTGFAAWGEANYRRFPAAWKHWMANIRLSFLGARGLVPEVLSGESRRILATAVPHQLFSSLVVITPFIRGILGLEADASNREVRLDPYLPPGWKFLRLRNFRLGNKRFNIEIVRKKGELEVRGLSPALTSQNSRRSGGPAHR